MKLARFIGYMALFLGTIALFSGWPLVAALVTLLFMTVAWRLAN